MRSNLIKLSVLTSLTLIELLNIPSAVFAASPTATISASPASGSYSVNTPFNVSVVIDGGGQAFNGAQATVALSSNMSVQSLTNGSCNFTYVTTPTTTNPSFAGAILGGSSTNCSTYTLALNPTAAGTGTITFSNESVTAFSDSSNIFSSAQDGNYTFTSSGSPTPTPVPTVAPTSSSTKVSTGSSLPNTGNGIVTILSIITIALIGVGILFTQIRLKKKEIKEV